MSDHQDHPRGGDAGTERDLTREIEALRVDVATLVGRDAASELRSEVAALRAGVGQVLERLDALSARLDVPPTSQQGLLEELQDNLADVASGEVVGELWDEVRRLRADLPDLLVVPEPVAAAAPEPDPRLTALTDELAVLRTELAEGLVVEPSDALSASLDALRAEVDGLRDALGEVRATPEPVPAPPVDDGRDEQLLEQLDAIRVGIDGVHARLDEGLVLADDAEATGGERSGGDIESIADQVAALRDFMASELDTVRQTVSARLDAAAEATATTVAELAARPEPAAAPAPAAEGGLDPETIEVLRDEIRASGAIGDQVVDALREELKALRRRIAVKATERVLDDEQLAQIADAVAARLAEDRPQD